MILIFSVLMCIIGSKIVVFEGGGGSGGPPPEVVLAVFIQNGAILCNNDGVRVLRYYETTRE